MKDFPLVAIVGRPNVGKSTLFNALTKTRLAIVADQEGVTRDRRIHNIRPSDLDGREIRLMDTGGWMPEAWRRERKDQEILRGIETQILAGLKEACLVLFVVDARAGRLPLDDEIAKFLRREGKKFTVLCNKIDTDKQENWETEFRALGGEGILPVSAEHRRGIGAIWQEISSRLPAEEIEEGIVSDTEAESEAKELKVPSARSLPFADRPIRICILGRPNVGKSSFLNALLREERAVESAIPGTTTDPIDVDFDFMGQKFTIIDTAGIRRHSKRADDVENLSVMYAKRNLEKVDLAFLVLDAADGVTAQDAKIASLLCESGAAAVVIANKWDLAPESMRAQGERALAEFVKSAAKEIPFLDYAPIVALSAKESRVYSAVAGADADHVRPLRIRSDIDALWYLAKDLCVERDHAVPTVELNKVLVETAPRGPNIAESVGKVLFAHRVGVRSPVFCAYVQNPKKIPDSYRRYLTKTVRSHFGFRGNPIRWIFRKKKDIRSYKESIQEYRKFLAEREAQ
jgi:GTP-binding protein